MVPQSEYVDALISRCSQSHKGRCRAETWGGGESAWGHAGVPGVAATLGWRAEPRTFESEAKHQRQFAAVERGRALRGRPDAIAVGSL